MALRNGLLIHGPTAWGAAARAPDGRVEVAAGPKPSAPPALTAVPVLRGPVKLLEGFAVIPLARRRLRSARLPFEDPRVLLAGVLVAASSSAIRRARPGAALREAATGVLGLLPAMVALRDRELAAYHGVEHKAIGAYERGTDDLAAVPKEHDRCGSHLIVPLLAFSVAGQVILERLSPRPGPVARGIGALAGVSAAVELFAWSERHPDSRLARAFRRPGTRIQSLLATREPTAEQLEVGSLALAAVLAAEGAEPDQALS